MCHRQQNFGRFWFPTKICRNSAGYGSLFGDHFAKVGKMISRPKGEKVGQFYETSKGNDFGLALVTQISAAALTLPQKSISVYYLLKRRAKGPQ